MLLLREAAITGYTQSHNRIWDRSNIKCQNTLPMQTEVKKELVEIEQPKNWHTDPAQSQGTPTAFWQQLVNKWSSQQQHKSSPLCHE